MNDIVRHHAPGYLFSVLPRTRTFWTVQSLFWLVLLPINWANAASYSYLTLDATSDDSDPYQTTRAWGVNNNGQVSGQTSDGAGTGFLWSGGVYTSILGPSGNQANAFGINDSGQIVGAYPNGLGGAWGFVKSAGNYVTLDFPGSNENAGTFSRGINNQGTVVGYFAAMAQGAYDSGFTWNGGVYTPLPLPSVNIESIEFDDINDVGQIVGTYSTASAPYGVSFIESNGVYSPVYFPGAGLTYVYGINNLGDVAGFYTDAIGVHGFVEIGEIYSTLDFPGSLPGSTKAYGINDEGQVVGEYSTGLETFGFIATPVPEPSALMMVATAILTCLAFARRPVSRWIASVARAQSIKRAAAK